MTPHGLPSTYNSHGCRCPAAVRQYQKIRHYDALAGRPRIIAAMGTIRRVCALAAIGWHLADRLGVSRQNVSQIQHRRRVTSAIGRVMAALYDELSMTPGPSAVIRAYARRHSWAPTLAWNDGDLDSPDAAPGLGLTRLPLRCEAAAVEPARARRPDRLISLTPHSRQRRHVPSAARSIGKGSAA